MNHEERARQRTADEERLWEELWLLEGEFSLTELWERILNRRYRYSWLGQELLSFWRSGKLCRKNAAGVWCTSDMWVGGSFQKFFGHQAIYKVVRPFKAPGS